MNKPDSIYVLWVKEDGEAGGFYHSIHRTLEGALKERDSMIAQHPYMAQYFDIHETELCD